MDCIADASPQIAKQDYALESALTSATLYFRDLWQSRDSDCTQHEVMRLIATASDGMFNEE